MSTFDPILAWTNRCGFKESFHLGRIAVTDPDGSVELAIGRVDEQLYPRSASKLLQAIAMIECGLDLADAELALAAASHSGEPMHLHGVRSILQNADLTLDDLDNTPAYPLDESAQETYIRQGGTKSSLAQNCSGKHAAMLRTCAINGWDKATYTDPQHPLQVAITGVVERFGQATPHIGVDGCGAPAHTMSLTSLARTYGFVAAAKSGAAGTLADAWRRFPEYVSGTNRWEYRLHQAVPGLLCKIGAEGVLGIGLPNGQGIAIKVMDGSARALPTIAVELLGLFGMRSEALAAVGSVPVLGHGDPVGEIECDLTNRVATD